MNNSRPITSRDEGVFVGATKKPKLQTELRETIFDRFVMLISIVAFCLVLLFVTMQVLIRYVTVHFGFSLPWTEEAARYLMVFFTFFGSAVACRTKEHITITTLADRFPYKARLLLEVISCLLIILFLVAAIPGTYSYTRKMIVAPVGSISWLKVGHIYGAMTVALVLIGVYQVRWLVYYVAEIKKSFSRKEVNDCE